MAKQDTQPEIPAEDIVPEEVKDIMGPTPDEAPVVYKVPINGEETSSPIGPPEVSEEIAVEAKATEKLEEHPSEVSEAAKAINKSLEEQVKADIPTSDSETTSDDLGDKATDAAVSEIIAKESDELLAAADAKYVEAEPKKSKRSIRGFFAAWWHNKRARTLTLSALAALFIGLALFPSTRYTILNALGVRSGLSLQVIDSKYGLPIKNVEVTAGGQKGTSDADGQVSLTGVKLGKTQLLLAKRSFEPISQAIIVGWGSNPFNDPLQMTPTGSAYSFELKDWLSGKPIAKVEISDSESTAVTDDSGKAVLTIEPRDSDIELSIKHPDYRTEKITISSNDKDIQQLKLVAGKPNVFVSKRSGKYDVYKRDVDGKNELVLLPGTGSEQDPMGLLVHPNADVSALVSTREGKRDSNGYLLSNLYIIDNKAKTVTKVDGTESAQIQIIDWVGDSLVYVKVAAGQSAATNARQRLIAFDYRQEKQTELASANYFNDVGVYKGQVYFAPSSTGSQVGNSAQLYRVNVDNSSKTSIMNKETWVTYRTLYDKILASTADNMWYEQKLGDNKMTALSGAPASPAHRIYIDSPSGEKTVWVDNRDGKGVLILQGLKSPSEKVILSKGGLGYPIRWLSNSHLLVRVSNSQETADYVINIEGGEAQKIGDVTNTTATNRWYYYR